MSKPPVGTNDLPPFEQLCVNCGEPLLASALRCGRCGHQVSQMKDFFISYTQSDSDWARWIAQQLESAGYSTIFQARDFAPGGNFVVQMHRALQMTQRTIAVISQEYLEASYATSEWAETFRRDPSGEYRLLVPVRVRPCSDLRGLLGARVYIDLIDQVEEAARRRLLDGVQDAQSKQLPPVPFPGMSAMSAVPIGMVAPVGLPRPASLVGREKELGTLMELLRSGTATAIYALNGMGGVGKTAVAAETVAQLSLDRKKFPGGAAWISCEGLEGTKGLDEVWRRVAHAIGLERTVQLTGAETRRTELAKALAQFPHLLLALDNVEPRLDAEVLLVTLSVPGHTTLLLTARQAIAPERLRSITLQPLPNLHAEKLFFTRLKQVDHGQTEENGTDKEPLRTFSNEEMWAPLIVLELGGLPLAIELVAGYTGIQKIPLSEVLRELSEDKLQAVPLNFDAKRAIRNCFDRSWRVLSLQQQRLFAGLALMNLASFPRDAALAIGVAVVDATALDISGSLEQQAQKDVATLVSYALIEALQEPKQWLRLHPLLREYANERFQQLDQTTQLSIREFLSAFWRAYRHNHPSYEGMTGIEADNLWEANEEPVKEATRTHATSRVLRTPGIHAEELLRLALHLERTGEFDRARARILECLTTGYLTAECNRLLARIDKHLDARRIPVIIISQGERSGYFLEIGQKPISIGRSPTCDIFLEDLTVSHLHASIYRDEKGNCWLRDEQSRNGTCINNQQISKSILIEGDEMKVGQTILIFTFH